jgi:peptidyl-tRNA hydrolase, PTH1 family
MPRSGSPARSRPARPRPARRPASLTSGPRVRGPAAPVDWLLVGLGNPGAEYAGTRHNVGFEIANLLRNRWDLPKAKTTYRGLLTQGRAGPSGARVAILLPQTYMNDAGQSVGPARGALKVPLDHVLVLHDEIDLPFGEIRVRLGGGLAGHNGLKSLKQGLGSADFARVRVGVGRPESTDPELVAAYVLGRFREPRQAVASLMEQAADAAERVVQGESALLD